MVLVEAVASAWSASQDGAALVALHLFVFTIVEAYVLLPALARFYISCCFHTLYILKSISKEGKGMLTKSMRHAERGKGESDQAIRAEEKGLHLF